MGSPFGPARAPVNVQRANVRPAEYIIIIIITLQEHTNYNESEILYGKHELTQLLKVHNRLPIRPEGYMCLRCNASSAWATNIPCTREMYAIIGGKVIPKSTMNLLFKGSK